MITEKDKELLTEWLSMNLQMTSKSNVELIVSHVDRYFQSPPVEAAGVEELVRLVAYKAWKGAANAFRLYPDNNHTFHDYWDAAKNQFEEEIKPLNQYCHQNDDRYEQLKRDHIKLFDQSTEKDRTIAELTELLDKISNGQNCIVSRTGIGEYTIAFKPDRNTESDNQNQSK